MYGGGGGGEGAGFPSARTVPEFIDPVFAKTSPKRAFSMTKNERFGLVFTKTILNINVFCKEITIIVSKIGYTLYE